MHPRHLSLFEKGVLGLHHQYNPKLDAEAKKNEAMHTASERLQVLSTRIVLSTLFQLRNKML